MILNCIVKKFYYRKSIASMYIYFSMKSSIDVFN